MAILIAAGIVVAVANEASAAQTLRLQVDQKGDFVLIGNTLGHECAAGTPAPVVGNANCGGSSNDNDSAPDIFWCADAPGVGQAQANTSITVAQARSSSVLQIPAGASVTHAFLYWGANAAGGDNTVTLDRQGGFTQTVTADQMYTSGNNSYQGVADVTSTVQANGAGAYRVSGVNAANIVNLDDGNNFAGWWMVVFYELATDPPRNLALFDGLDPVTNGNPQNLTLSGFLVPPVFTAAKLGIVAFGGDNTLTGDSFSFGPAPALSNALNPATNFFNSTRSFLGVGDHTTGDLPELAGTPQSHSGIDMDVVDVTNKLMAGQYSVPISATSSGDVYYLAGFVTSIPTFKPDFGTSAKTAVDLNGGALLPGDIIEYTVVAGNTGNDTAVNTIMNDPLPMGVTYVPGSIAITAGANAGAKTDMTADDQCEYVMATNTVTCRIGVGADAAQGGTLLVGESSTITFQVTVNADASGIIYNQALITASGLLGAPAEDTPTDGNGPTGGQPPTPVVIDACETDAQCMAPTPYCNTVADPNVCFAPECGNSDVEIGEGCDDGNTVPNDGCNSSCLLELGQPCTLGPACASGFCDPVGSICVCDDNADCSNGQLCNTVANPNICVNPGCANNVLEANEGCDDGNANNGDGCDSMCLKEIGQPCTLWYTCASSFCDPVGNICACDANGDCPSGQLCATTPNPNQCVNPGCGNFVLEANEACDDGNTTPGDGCNSLCLKEIGQTCSGNAVCASGFCDSANATCACDQDADCSGGQLCNTVAAPNACVNPGCGNNVLETNEGCDDGNTIAGDGCNSVCLLELGESCTAATSCASGFCDSTGNICACNDDSDCAIGAVCNTAKIPNTCVTAGCGNGVLEVNEGCDDGNTATGDGCNATCLLEIDEACSESSACVSGFCDSAGSICACTKDADCTNGTCNTAADPNTCVPLDCGDGILSLTEECDDGNRLDDDGCDSNCTATSCGNGIPTTGEHCDDGNLVDDDDCPNTCRRETAEGSGGAGGGSGNSIDQPGGCSCSLPEETSTNAPAWLALLVALGGFRLRRRA